MNLSLFNELERNMFNQLNLFNNILAVNTQFRNSIIEKEWTGVNLSIDKMNVLTQKINDLDLERDKILQEIYSNDFSKDSKLKNIIDCSPKEIRDNLRDLFYKLKTSLIQVKGVFKGVDNFIQHKIEVSKEIIDVLLKDAKGNVYSKPGRRDIDGQGFLVNKQL